MFSKRRVDSLYVCRSSTDTSSTLYESIIMTGESRDVGQYWKHLFYRDRERGGEREERGEGEGGGDRGEGK